jgi:hypothetical protein
MDAVARLVADLYPQVSGGQPVDGVLYADPTAFAALLQVTGPVEAEGLALSADDAVQFLTVDQYVAADGEARPVTPLIRSALDRFTDSALPGPTRLADVFGPVVRSGHLQLALVDSGGATLAGTVGLDQPLRRHEGGDLVAVINRNANPSKIDAYLRREIDYLVDWDPEDGDVRSRLVVTLHNDAPASGLPPLVIGSSVALPPGTNRTELSMLSPLDAVGAMVDGQASGFGTRTDVDGLHRYALLVDLPPGGTRTVVFDLEGRVRPGTEYDLTWYNQPLPADDSSRLVVEPVGTTLAGGEDRGSVAVGTRRVERLSVRAEP